jgi:hypothetical protein
MKRFGINCSVAFIQNIIATLRPLSSDLSFPTSIQPLTDRTLLLIGTCDTPVWSAMNMQNGAKEYFSSSSSGFEKKIERPEVF